MEGFRSAGTSPSNTQVQRLSFKETLDYAAKYSVNIT